MYVCNFNRWSRESKKTAKNNEEFKGVISDGGIWLLLRNFYIHIYIIKFNINCMNFYIFVTVYILLY